ncbi:hypothetical protein ASD65_05925 [Microbacterium sp. Root61]|uniref:DUF5107 domain-containing protein n=1 Tax=Microbacterium sp. Root61 TaxID=1736570 RepID=UPI0006FFA504|nr:DUF5107 domain-containing protein [Microbacterium sp. Root61]KRA24011.1 hypothetical protein ASD65_05925 [Microbacterium sp. Root61]
MTAELNDPRDAAYDELTLPDPPAELRTVLENGAAVAWSEALTIRTYEAGTPSAYPMFFDHRVYQGSSGKVYPIPFTESVADEPVLRDWQAVHLENAYVRLVVLPELGGRIHIGYDKITGHDFFYRNNVIKPALVGLAGPWISGGVEFNWPQHHRPATYLPVQTTIENGADGSVTVWCHDHDPFARMSGQHGVRLRPDSSVVEVVVRLHNRTDERQTFLWWANAAARVHDDYQSFFPEDVRYVADHARRALTAFPGADRSYYGVDYPARAEDEPDAHRIDWYRNIPVPTSYMIVDSQQDFFGGYDHAAGAGFVHWAERRVSPGKKLWTWGDAPFGHAWDDQLTDGDGPYIELMAGVYTDNQPDFTWILPGETKVFSQYWYPVPAMGTAHQATPDAAVHVERSPRLVATFAVTGPQPRATLRVRQGGEVVASRTQDLTPGEPAAIEADVTADEDLSVELLDRDGRLLVRWTPTVVADEESWVADEPPLPEAIESVEELYLTGLHLSQYRHPTRSPLLYWNVALERDPADVRVNLALADREYRLGLYESALARIDIALARLTRRNANPQDAEGFYLRGLVLRRLGRTTEAEQAFGKAGWDGAWAAAAGFALAESLAFRGQNRSALRVLDTLDGVVAHDTRRIALRAIILRRLGDEASARRLLLDALRIDPLDATMRVLAGVDVGPGAGLLFDVALDLRNAGATDAALEVLAQAVAVPVTASGNLRPVAHYVAAGILQHQGALTDAAAHRAAARTTDPTWAFPHGLDALDALESTLAAEPADPVAHALLGMLLYAHGRRREAVEHWDAAIELGGSDPVLLRNAALAEYNIRHDDEAAWRRYAQAIALAPEDARLRYEQDQLAGRLGQSVAERLARLRAVESLVLTRDDLTIEYLQLLVAEGAIDRAEEILTDRRFHPWEGGEGKVLAAWDAVQSARGRDLCDPPANLGETRSPFVPPATRRDDGVTDYFATSLPELLLFARE